MKLYQQHFDLFWPKLKDTSIANWQVDLPPMLMNSFNLNGNGNLKKWHSALSAIKYLPQSEHFDLNRSAIYTGSTNQILADNLSEPLKSLMPWRKGPFDIEGIYIDTEWRSDWKWNRIISHLSPLKGRKILDIGCGSGYHLWRMMGEEAELTVGVDPSLLSMTQFLVLKHFIGENLATYFLPLTLEQLPIPQKGGAFDTVFSMGVLYHRRSPIDHILDLKRHLIAGGELVLETLVISEKSGQLLVPKNRYAQMNNVWFIPSVSELIHWLKRCGFKNLRCVDINQTSIQEQRSTKWMAWNSLADFLDPKDASKTLEGYPAPLRAVIIGEAPK